MPPDETDVTTVATDLPTSPLRTPEHRRWAVGVPRPAWAALAIVSMWLAVLFDAIFGPDFVSTSGSGSSATTIPSAIFVALFAFLGTRVVARYGFGREDDDGHR
jgi:hypothetical protein